MLNKIMFIYYTTVFCKPQKDWNDLKELAMKKQIKKSFEFRRDNLNKLCSELHIETPDHLFKIELNNDYTPNKLNTIYQYCILHQEFCLKFIKPINSFTDTYPEYKYIKRGFSPEIFKQFNKVDYIITKINNTIIENTSNMKERLTELLDEYYNIDVVNDIRYLNDIKGV